MGQIVVAIVTYNAEKWIRTCLESLMASTVPVHTLIADNASKDRTPEILQSGFPAIPVTHLDANLGFGQANNILLQEARGEDADYVFLLNQDAYVDPGTIETLIAAHQAHPGYGIISPVQLNGAGDSLDGKFRRYLLRHYPSARVDALVAGDTPEMLPVRFVNAAAWLLSRACLERTGLFHPAFFHYGEDNNYCARAQYQGFKTGVYAGSRVRHDRAAAARGTGALEKKIRQVPLYTVLDIRKPACVAWLAAGWKITGYVFKSLKAGAPELRKAALAEWRRLRRQRTALRRARQEMKGPYGLEKSVSVDDGPNK